MHSLALFLLQDSPASNAAAAGLGFAVLFFFWAIFILVAIVATVVPVWHICKKAGFSPWLSLLIFVPLGFIILLYILAFAQWPSQRQPIQAAWPNNPQFPPQPPYPQA